MASYTLATGPLHKTLAGTTVDTITIPNDAQWVEVVNRAGTAALYTTDNGDTPVADADGTEIVQAGEILTIDNPRSRTLKILGNGNTYDLAWGR